MWHGNMGSFRAACGGYFLPMHLWELLSRQYAEISMLSVQLCLPVRGHLGVCVCACMCASSCQISHTECETLTLGFLLTLPLACISCTCSSAPSLSPDMFPEARHSPCPMMWHSTALCGGQKWPLNRDCGCGCVCGGISAFLWLCSSLPHTLRLSVESLTTVSWCFLDRWGLHMQDLTFSDLQHGSHRN